MENNKVCIDDAKNIPYDLFDNTEITDLELNLWDAVDYDKFEEIRPNFINRLTKLRKLSFFGVIVSDDIFKNEICKLSFLEELIIISSKIREIPVEIAYLTKLKILVLRNNKIDVIPEPLCNLENLEEINFIDNKIIEIPSSILNLKKLKEFNLRNNPLNLKYINMRKEFGEIDLDKFKLTQI